MYRPLKQLQFLKSIKTCDMFSITHFFLKIIPTLNIFPVSKLFKINPLHHKADELPMLRFSQKVTIGIKKNVALPQKGYKYSSCLAHGYKIVPRHYLFLLTCKQHCFSSFFLFFGWGWGGAKSKILHFYFINQLNIKFIERENWARLKYTGVNYGH